MDAEPVVRPLLKGERQKQGGTVTAFSGQASAGCDGAARGRAGHAGAWARGRYSWVRHATFTVLNPTAVNRDLGLPGHAWPLLRKVSRLCRPSLPC